MLNSLACLNSQHDQNSCLLPFQCWFFWLLLIVSFGLLCFSLQVQQLQGVYNLQEPHFWTLCTDVYIGTLKLLVAPDADSRWILSQTHNIFTQVRETARTKVYTVYTIHICILFSILNETIRSSYALWLILTSQPSSPELDICYLKNI